MLLHQLLGIQKLLFLPVAFLFQLIDQLFALFEVGVDLLLRLLVDFLLFDHGLLKGFVLLLLVRSHRFRHSFLDHLAHLGIVSFELAVPVFLGRPEKLGAFLQSLLETTLLTGLISFKPLQFDLLAFDAFDF